MKPLKTMNTFIDFLLDSEVMNLLLTVIYAALAGICIYIGIASIPT